MNAPDASPEAVLFHQVVASRRSVRAFAEAQVPQEVLDRCLDAARMAPSSSNLQPWQFVVIRDHEARKAAAAVCLDQKVAQAAPLLVALVARRDTVGRHRRLVLDTLEERGILRESQKDYWGRKIPFIYFTGPCGLFGWMKKGLARLLSLRKPTPNFYSRADLRVMTHKSTALAAATFMLALRAEGYDSCPIEGFDPWRARTFLGLKRGAEVCMFIAVGQRGGENAVWWERILVPREWAVKEM